MGRPKKTVKDYERESIKIGKCLIHPTAHIARHVYQLRHKNLPANLHVCHTCDTPLCILDGHHFVGTNLENQQDSVRKGRKKAAMNRPEVRALQSKVQRARFEGPGAEAARNVLRIAFNRQEVKDKKRAAGIAAWARLDVYEMKCKTIKEACNTPKEISRKRRAALSMWQRPEYRKKRQDAYADAILKRAKKGRSK